MKNDQDDEDDEEKEPKRHVAASTMNDNFEPKIELRSSIIDDDAMFDELLSIEAFNCLDNNNLNKLEKGASNKALDLNNLNSPLTDETVLLNNLEKSDENDLQMNINLNETDKKDSDNEAAHSSHNNNRDDFIDEDFQLNINSESDANSDSNENAIDADCAEKESKEIDQEVLECELNEIKSEIIELMPNKVLVIETDEYEESGDVSKILNNTQDENNGDEEAADDDACALRFKSVSSIEDNSTDMLLRRAPVEQVKIWSDAEALLMQVPQTDASSCGLIAIINVLKALQFEFDFDRLCAEVRFNRRDERAPLPQYLFSRSVAGMNAAELMENLVRVTSGTIVGRFFPFWPPTSVDVVVWLAHWMARGAVPVALLNLQREAIWGFVPDAWHFQMIYGCDGKETVFLTNPVESKSVQVLSNELASESVLLVRSWDVVKFFRLNGGNLADLALVDDRRWTEMNVLGQVVHVLREFKFSAQQQQQQTGCGAASSVPVPIGANGSLAGCSGGCSNLTTHVKIPASYVPGIMLFVYSDSTLAKELFEAPDLPCKL